MKTPKIAFIATLLSLKTSSLISLYFARLCVKSKGEWYATWKLWKWKFVQLPLSSELFLNNNTWQKHYLHTHNKILLLQLHSTHCIIDSKSSKNSAWGLVYKPGSLVHLKTFFMVLVTQKESEIVRKSSKHRCR